jgi:hypothetical protein
MLILLVGRAQTQALRLDLTPPAASHRHTGRIAPEPLRTTRRVPARRRGIATEPTRLAGHRPGCHAVGRPEVACAGGGGGFVLPGARLSGASHTRALSPLGSFASQPNPTRPPWPQALGVDARACGLRQLSTVTPRRHPWTHNATQRGDRARSQRTPLVRLSAERDRATHALTAALARLPQLESHQQGVAVLPQVARGWLAWPLLCVTHSGWRAVSRVLRLRALALGLTHAPCPQTSLHGVRRLALVRIESARRLRGVPRRPAPLSHGLLGRIDRRLGVGTGTIVAVLAVDAPHPHRTPRARSLDRGRCRGGSVADAWTGATLAAWLGRLLAVRGRPAASLQDGGGDLHNAVA